LIRYLHRKNPNSKILVTGCLAQTDSGLLASEPGVVLVVDNKEKSIISDYIRMLGGEAVAKRESSVFGFFRVLPSGHTRAYLKVQDGCDYRCSYCKIPDARGSAVSRNAAEAIREARTMEDAGIREIVITGINTGTYKDSEKKLDDLIESILHATKYVRIRLSSIEPELITEKLIQLTRHPRFCRFFHIPLQSGSGRILKLMQRHYTPSYFINKINKIKNFNPDIFLGTDVMTGFPGESDQDFNETMYVLETLRFPNIHVFRYSRRSGTAASAMQETDKTIAKKRSEIIKGNINIYFNEYAERFRNRSVPAIVEGSKTGGRALGDNFLRLHFDPSYGLKRGSIYNFFILDILPDGKIMSRPVSEHEQTS